MENQRLENLLQNELFMNGVSMGISIHQQMILASHERNEPLKINNELYYIRSGNELLQQMLDAVCQ